MRGFPVVGGLGVDVDRHRQRHGRLGAPSPSPRCNDLQGLGDLGLARPRTPVRRAPAAACARDLGPLASSAPGMRIMARRMMSAAEPWIGALIAARSRKPRIDGFLRVDLGVVDAPAEDRSRHSRCSCATLLRRLHVVADAGEALEVGLDVGAGFLAWECRAGWPGRRPRCRR